MSTKSCLGPYSITCDSLIKINDFTFVDNNKTKLVAIITPCNSIPNIPSDDAILIHEIVNCPKLGCDIRWYECINTLGRTYSLIVTGCESLITNYNNGFLKDGHCDTQIFGTESFCFGKVYLSNQNYLTEKCKTIFEFDDHVFKITGIESHDFGLFDCSFCENITSVFSEDNPTPDAPPAIQPIEIEEPSQVSITNKEERVIWNTGLPNSVNKFINSGQESTIGSVSDCGSQNKPSIANLPSGHSIIIYENRKDSGITGINLSVINSSVPFSIFYYRKLSFGILHNDDQFVYGSGTFDIFDDIVFDLNENNEPTYSLLLGFLNGPLKGQTFPILSILRSEQENGRIKNSISFDSSGTEPVFDDSNNINDTSYFIAKSTLENPGGEQLQSIIDIPQHLDSSGNEVPMSNPSIAIADNNLMIDGTQNVFLSYQAYENNQWNLYLLQLRFSEKDFSLPSYIEPYHFESPSTQEFTISNGSNIIYRVVSSSDVGIARCFLFEAYLSNGTQIKTCNSDSNEFVHPCGNVVNNSVATLEITYRNVECSASFNFSIGDEITAPYPPNADDFPDGLPQGGGESCILSFSVNPDSSLWCYKNSDCPIFYVKEDPYCPLPYASYIYKPEDLWLIRINDDFVTRVKYNLSISGNAETQKTISIDQIDFMFVIDYSVNMGSRIQKIIDAIPNLNESLSSQGFDVRYGLTVFGRDNIDDPNADMCSGCFAGSYVFNGLRTEDGGFTRNISTLQSAMSIDADGLGPEPGYSAIVFALTNPQYLWRNSAKRVIFLITDTTDQSGTCIGIDNDQTLAVNTIYQYDVSVGIAISTIGDASGCGCEPPNCTGNGSGYLSLINAANPSLGQFSVDGPYDNIFKNMSITIGSSITNARVLERDEHGYNATFLKDAEVIVTYAGDLSDIWTNEKNNLVFVDNAPVESSMTKGLTQLPFDLVKSKIYNIDPVHCNGNLDNWIFFTTGGPLKFNYPNIGVPESGRSSPILIANNAINGRLSVNNRNEIFCVYQSLETGLPQIGISGTGDFAQNSITGPKARRMTRFYTSSDFSWLHNITDLNENINQVCDLVIDRNDIIHVTWQSNRDKVWEIYYANSFNYFEPIRVTNVESKSVLPRIDLDKSGTVFIVYQDNRFGPYEIMLAAKKENRVLPLLQQDAYLASLAANYSHYTNTLPIFIKNPIGLLPAPGELWCAKNATGSGNDNENFLFSVNPETGHKQNQCDSSPFEVKSIASSRNGKFYGIDTQNNLLLISSVNQDPYVVNCNDIEILGNLGIQAGVQNLVLSDEFIGSGITDPLKWIQSNILTLPSVAGPGGDWFPTSVNAIMCNGSLDACNNECEPCTLGFHVYAHIWGIITLDPVLPRSIRTQFKAQWKDFGPENYFSPELMLVFKNSNTESPFHGITFKQTECSGSGCVQDLIISYTDGPSTTIANFAPFKNQWADVKIDSVETDGTITGKKNLTISVFINDVQYYSYTRENLSNSDTGMGNYYGVGTYRYFIPSAQDLNTGKFVIDNISYTDIDPDLISSTDILDMSVDHVERIWILVGDKLVNSNLNLRLLEIDQSSGKTLNEKTIYKNVTELVGGLTILNDGTFYVSRKEVSKYILSRADFPILSLSSVSINFSDVSELDQNIKLLTSDFEDTLFGLDENNKLYTIETDGTTVLKSDLSLPDSSDAYLLADPIGVISGLGYKFSGKFNPDGINESFHVLIKFYDNINLDGDPDITIDSRNNLESFIDVIHEDAYFAAVKGIELPPGHSAIVYFDASNLRPTNTLSYPYGFESNKTYFPQAYSITSDGKIQSLDSQPVSFSCNKCSRIGDNNTDYSSCSFSFEIDPGHYNFLVEFYGDADFKHKVVEYKAVRDSNDLIYFEVNNVNANTLWGDEGLDVPVKSLVQIYPVLDQNSGLLCDITYYVKVKKCNSSKCDDYLEFTSGEFKCNCTSNIFGITKPTLLSELARWESSAFGYSDTRITDSTSNNLNPSIKVRSSDSAIIMFENYASQTPTLKGATFRKSEPIDDQLSSGTRSWFDYNFETIGQNPSISIDLYDRVSSVYTRIKDDTKSNLPSFTLYSKSFDFSENVNAEEIEKCDLSTIESNILSKDNFILESVIKKVLINPKDVDYYSYNAAGETISIVSKCNLGLQIWGTPEVVAFRLRNENQSFWSSWCAYSPEISSNYTEQNWVISAKSGLKEICIQFMTYNGVTAEKCIQVVADYTPISFEIKTYSDENYSKELPVFNEISVASTLYGEKGDANYSKNIYVEIIPNQLVSLESINFDVLQQGLNDIYDLKAVKSTSSDGRDSFRGVFRINIEDNITNKDGLAQIKPKFPGVCEFVSQSVVSDGFVKDNFNLITQDSIASSELDDVLSGYRNNISGKIGVGLILRPSDDPYFVFGDPDFFLKDK